MEVKEKSPERLAILKKIEEYEENGWFDQDVEEDPPTKELFPDQVDYLGVKLKSKIATWYSFHIARKFLNKMKKEHQFIIKEIKGIENIQHCETGAILTCNHFNALDSFAMQMAMEATGLWRKRKMYRIIREGNYTSFKGFYGMLMRHCDTLPLSSNHETMKHFFKAVDGALKNKDFVLIYPEQSLWWNYRKPKPLKNGGYHFAVKNEVPVIPCFITMQDSPYFDGDGFPVQEYTIHIEKPIYPCKDKTTNENVNFMKEENYRIWKNIYENVYQTPLTYKSKVQ